MYGIWLLDLVAVATSLVCKVSNSVFVVFFEKILFRLGFVSLLALLEPRRAIIACTSARGTE